MHKCSAAEGMSRSLENHVTFMVVERRRCICVCKCVRVCMCIVCEYVVYTV